MRLHFVERPGIKLAQFLGSLVWAGSHFDQENGFGEAALFRPRADNCGSSRR